MLDNDYSYPMLRNQCQENKLVFSTNVGAGLISHSDISFKRHIKVRGDKSYFDGDVLYWSTRKGTHPELPNRVAFLLKKYKGRCAECGLMFVGDDLIEVDHTISKQDGGKDKFDNLQPLHRHCHDVKTARDNASRKILKQEAVLEPLEGYINEQGDWCC